MYKEHLLNVIVKEMKICKRLYTKIPPDKIHFRPKENIRSILELLHYLTYIGTAMPNYWLQEGETDFRTFFGNIVTAAKEMPHEQYLSAMDDQIEMATKMFDQIREEDLFQKEVTYPWGGNAALGEGIMSTSVKFLSAYKLQLFSHIKLCSDQKLGTADAWILTELD